MHEIQIFAVFNGVLTLQGWVRTDGDIWFHSDDGQILAIDVVRKDDVAGFHTRQPVSSPTAHRGYIRIIDSQGERILSNIGPGPSPTQDVYMQFLQSLENKPGAFLEIGSRARSGVSRRSVAPANWTYTGLDIMQGENVDVVGDAHQLSRILTTERFDAVMAISVLEHILMPWKFVIELNRVMNTGGVGFFLSHQCWPLHDSPWDYWRFSDQAWGALLNRATGFEIIEAKMGEPVYVVPVKAHDSTNFGMGQFGYGSSVVMFRKVGETTLDWPVEVEAITETHYPA